MKTSSLQIAYTVRRAPQNGPSSSAKFNDILDELAHDLAAISDQWNNSLVTLLDTLPDGTIDVDAFVDGLSGSTLYVDPTATSTYNTTYYNTDAARPRTVYEQFVNLYTAIDTIQEDLSDQITQTVPTASQISISDAGGYYAAEDVETALEEVKSELDLLGNVTSVFSVIATTTSGYNATVQELVEIDATLAVKAVLLPDPTEATGRFIIVRNTGTGGNDVVVSCITPLVDVNGSPSVNLSDGDRFMFMSNGTEYFSIATG
jgi:hypothetical protein